MAKTPKPKTVKNEDVFQRRERLRAELECTILKARIPQVKQAYDVLETTNAKHRKANKIEMDSEEKILTPYNRLKSINLCRDLERNTSPTKTFIRQIKRNVVGTLCKIRFNTDDKEFNREAGTYFNSVFSKNCDGRDDNHWADIVQLVLASVVREGDILAVFDDFDEDDGTLLFWEADQLVAVQELDWTSQKTWVENKNGKKIPLKQSSGVIYNSKGRVKAYSVTNDRGLTVAPFANVTIFPRDVAKLVKEPWRLNLFRGVADLITPASGIQDIYEMISKELQSAKVASSMAMQITKNDALQDAILRGGSNPESILDASAGTPGATAELKQYEQFESLTGGITEYMSRGEKAELLNHNRPNLNTKDFYQFMVTNSGGSLGLSQSYSTMTPAGSYTAFRGDMLMAWLEFKCKQKFMERHFCDWTGIKATNWALRKGKIKTPPPEGWEYKISWLWPKMPQVDPAAETNADRESLRNGTTTYDDLIGPDWREKFDTLADQIEYARSKNLPLSIFETKAGAPVAQPEPQKNDKNNNNIRTR